MMNKSCSIYTICLNVVAPREDVEETVLQKHLSHCLAIRMWFREKEAGGRNSHSRKRPFHPTHFRNSTIVYMTVTGSAALKPARDKTR